MLSFNCDTPLLPREEAMEVKAVIAPSAENGKHWCRWEKPALGTLAVQLWKEASLGSRHSQGGGGRGKEKKQVRISRSEKLDRFQRTPGVTGYTQLTCSLSLSSLSLSCRSSSSMLEGAGHRQGRFTMTSNNSFII